MTDKPASNISLRPKVIYSMGGKGGVGKTTFMVGMAEYFASAEPPVPCTLLDLDTENKGKGALMHFFPNNCRKVDITKNEGLDVFINETENSLLTLADMGAGSGYIATKWFLDLYPILSDRIDFIAVGVVTSDPASVDSVLTWAAQLEHRVQYLIVKNQQTDDTSFLYWDSSLQANEFRCRHAKRIREITLEWRIPKMQDAVRNHGATLGSIINKERPDVAELTTPARLARASVYRTNQFQRLDTVRDMLLPEPVTI